MLRARRKRPTATKSATKSAAAAPTHVCSKLGACGQSWSISGFHRETDCREDGVVGVEPARLFYSGPLKGDGADGHLYCEMGKKEQVSLPVA